MVIDAFMQGLHLFADPQVWLLVGVGIIIGLVFGIVPGIGTMLAFSLLLPFVFLMGPDKALPMMMAIAWTGPTGGVISTVLVGVPGSTLNAATMIDGFAMTRNGEGARALGASLGASGFGAVLGAVMCIVMVPLILPLVYGINSGDMVFLIVMGLGFLATLSQESPLKGLISGGLGIIMAMVGGHVITGEWRFTFGTHYLMGGIPIIVTVMGLFAMPALLEMATAPSGVMGKVDNLKLGIGAVLQGVMDIFRHWWLWIRATAIGWYIGVVPGVGGSAASWVALGYAKQSSKHPERFGTGIVEGVIAPESAVCAEGTGALLTTLAIGIPGNSSMVLVLAALMIMHVNPGPEMMTTHLALTFGTIQFGLVSALLAAVLCVLVAPYLLKLVKVPTGILVPMIAIAVFIGAYGENGIYMDMVALLVMSLLGVAMKKYDFSRPALLLGFVMGDVFEKYLFIAAKTAGPLFFLKPTTLVIIALTIAVFAYDPVMKKIRARKAIRSGGVQ